MAKAKPLTPRQLAALEKTVAAYWDAVEAALDGSPERKRLYEEWQAADAWYRAALAERGGGDGSQV
jgi:hypothetical protein